MEALAIAAATLAAQWALEGFAKEAGKSSFVALKPIYEWVKSKLTSDGTAPQAAFDKLAADPRSQTNTTEVAKLLSDKLQAEPALKAELGQLVAAAEQDNRAHDFVVRVMDNAKVGKIVSIGTVIGNVTF
jgi:hypothetical protein